MTIDAFRKALHQRPLSQQERYELAPDELFVLVLAGKLDRLTDEERRKLKPADQRDLAAMGLIVSPSPFRSRFLSFSTRPKGTRTPVRKVPPET